MTNDLPQDETQDETLRKLVIDGIHSGPGSEVTEEYFERLRARARRSQLITSGRMKLPTRTGPLSHPPISDTMSSAEILDDIRRDRV